MSDETLYYYRLEDYREARGYMDEYDDWVRTGNVARLGMLRFKVVRETPCGVIIRDYGRDRFINRNWTKRYAAPSEGEAHKDFIARKRRQIEINEARALAARDALDLALGTSSNSLPTPVTLL